MTVGMGVAGTAFLVTALMQHRIDVGVISLMSNLVAYADDDFEFQGIMPFHRLTTKQASLWTVNTLPCEITTQWLQNGRLSEADQVEKQVKIRQIFTVIEYFSKTNFRFRR